jgi:hypothetical protein
MKCLRACSLSKAVPHKPSFMRFYMKNRILYVVIAAFMASALCGCGQSLMSAGQESQAIREVKKRVEDALNNGDARL